MPRPHQLDEAIFLESIVVTVNKLISDFTI